ncbi:MAG: hypothetical protein M9894_08330 [Planctomycetes bacterium]|nr:hypothetical protein [Planctomycetota bacterium]
MRGSAWAASLLVGLACLAPAARADDHADQPAGATPIAVGAPPTAGEIEVPGDVDWFRFQVVAGESYVVRTTRLGPGMDTVIGLWDARGLFVGRNDDHAGTLASRIDYTPQVSGASWLAVVHYDAAQGRGTYAVEVVRAGAAPAAVTPAVVTSTGAALLEAGPAFDPRLEGARLDVRTRLDGGGAYEATLSVRDAAGRVVRTLVAGAARQAGADHVDAWDGRDPAGRFVAPGAYTLRLEVARPGQPTAAVDRTVAVVRLGFVSIAFDDAGAGGARVPLDFHRAQAGVAGSRLSVDAVGPAWTVERSLLGDGALDHPDGAPLSVPAPWARLDTPPRAAGGGVLTRGRSLPVAYAAGARPTLRIRMGDAGGHGGQAVACGYPLPGAPVRLVLGGEASADLAPGGEVVLRGPTLPQGIGRHDLALDFRFEVWDGQGWSPVPGRVRTTHRVYTLLGRPPTGANVRRPWVAVVDKVAQWSAGRARDVAGALEVITRGVYEAEGLVYDTWFGAPAYSDGNQLWEPELDLDGWLHRTRGRVVNCLDCAALVTALAAQVGASAEVCTVGDNFSLHWIRGIGGQRFVNDLFGGWHAFSFHAVATIDRAATIHDACLSVDDDARPDAAPHVERLPVGMPFARYRQQLSPDPFRVTGLGRSTVR